MLAGVSAATLAAYFLPQRTTGWGPDAPRAEHRGFGIASDVTGAYVGTALLVGGAWALEGGYLAAAGASEPYARALRTTLVDVEAAAVATGITQAIKRLSGRCRPRAFRDGRCAGGELDAFPSGHTSPVSAVAGARLVLALRSGGDPALRFVALGAAEGASLATAALRVLAGAHSFTDVAAGWVLGHATGATLAAFHPMESLSPSSAAARAAPAGSPVWVGWSGSF